jgi:predicted transcriptional regulator
MTKYRSKLEIVADILDAVGDGAKKTRIMYIANLSYKLLGKYLTKTIEAGLVSSDDNNYEVTEKGRVFLERFKTFSGRYSRINKEFEKVSFEREVLEKMCELTTSGNENLGRGRRRR